MAPESMNMPELIVRRDGAIGWIVFSNPAKNNAVTYQMIAAMRETVGRVERDPQVRVIAFTGEGGQSFVSGADIAEFGVTRSASSVVTYNHAMEEAYKAVNSSRKPTLACVRGPCFGVGLSLALYCDMRVCADDAEFSHTAAKLGLGVSYPSVKRLVDVIGPARAADVLFTGRKVGAAEALSLGLVNRVFPTADVEAGFRELASDIADNAPLSLHASKISIRGTLGEADLHEVRMASEACHGSDDYAEGRKAFIEKRKPNFRGR
jgi:enoyl-CoA hydratase/carnithine racemase